MWDNKTGRSRGYGFVSFRNQQARTSQTSPLWILQSFYHFVAWIEHRSSFFLPIISVFKLFGTGGFHSA